MPSNDIIVNKTFTLTGTNTTTGLAMPYKVGLDYVSEFSDGMIHYYIKRTSANTNVTSNLVGTANQTIPGNASETGYTHGTLKKGNRYLELVTGEFKTNTTNQTITFNLKLQFLDNNENQDSEKGKSFTGKIVINHELTISEYIADLDLKDNGLEVDDTLDNNLRYVGASPKNYLEFNNETWRIVGVFNNIITIDEKGKEKKESLVKIVRNESLGDYSWDSSESSVNEGKGINEWSQADLMYELNCDGSGNPKYCRDAIVDGYLSNKITGETKWYNESNNEKTATYKYVKNIKNSSIGKIATVRWNLGGIYEYDDIPTLKSYNYERDILHISNPLDEILRTNTWDGRIALIYPSDYGYASTETICRNNVLNCNTLYNWLYDTTRYWTLSPSSGYASFVIYEDGTVNNMYTHYSLSVRPVLFLKSDVMIVGGSGESIENAYTLE